MTSILALMCLAGGVDDIVEVRQSPQPLDVAKRSPLKFPPQNQPYEFEWLTEGYAHAWKSSQEPQLRFRVFSQDRKVHDQLAPATTQFLLKLWTYNFSELKVDHKPDYNRSCVDVYLCFAGDPGGEQLFDSDPQAKGISSKVNTIYIYDLPSFKEPLEKVREICHEYGHAALPAIGGYDKPEYWANGYLGEKLYMSWLAKQPDLTNELLLGCDPKTLRDYVQRACNPLMAKAATNCPTQAWMAGKSAESMDRYVGLMLWMQQVLPQNLVAQSMKIMKTYSAKEVPDALVEASEGFDSITVNLPSNLVGKKVWLPFGNRRISGAAINGKSGNWVAVTASKSTFTVR